MTLTENELDTRYCSHCGEGPQPCIVLSVDFEQVVLCEKCFTEVGEVFSEPDAELAHLPDDMPELKRKVVARVGIHDCLVTTTRYDDTGEFPQIEVTIGTRLIARLTQYKTVLMTGKSWWLNVGGDIVDVGEDEKEAVKKALKILGYVNANENQ